jgi:hypothetical protein
MFAGPEILLAPRGTRQRIPFVGQILDSLPPDVRAVTDEDVAKVQEEARALVRAQALARSHNLALSARNVSDIARVNRVEGLALGTGLTRQLGDGFYVTGRGRYGFDDRAVKGRAELGFRRASGAGFSIAGYRDYRDASDEMERSLVINSIAAQEFGSDYTDPFDVRGVSVAAKTGTFSAWNATIEAALERHYPLAVHASPASGRYEPTIAATQMRERRLSLLLDHPTRLTFGGIESQMQLRGDALSYRRADSSSYAFMGRVSAAGTFEKPIRKSRIVAHSLFAATMGDGAIPRQHLVYLGGPTSAPGYNFHEFVGTVGASQRLELRFPAPFPSFKLGRYGRTPATITLAPYVNTVWISDIRGPERWFPSVGLGALSIFDVIRLDVARGLRDGRWSFSMDIGRDFWRIL